ncbi:hypothetical protein NIES298_06270 [Microcystis aeruginosa NIES-298]|nr:hypothetical protein NIES298_06270 [Microcystis aeruginosa NIES-298]
MLVFPLVCTHNYSFLPFLSGKFKGHQFYTIVKDGNA